MSAGTNADQILRYKGFNVEIKGVDNAPTSVDGSWISISGGAKCVEVIEATVGNDGERRFTPGKAYVTDITLEGYMTPTRKALMTWMNNSARGQGDLRADLTITPVNIDGSTGVNHNYYNCMITRIQIPRLSAGSAEPVREVVVLKAERYNDPA
jgi:phage tail-like protein